MNARTEPDHLRIEVAPAPERAGSADVAHLRVPPHSAEAEQSVLGGLLLDNLAWDRAAELLNETDFYRYEHRLIFGAIAALVSTSRPADVITVFEQLQSHGKADDAGGLSYLNALAQSVPSAANMRRYAEIVRERALLRRIIAGCDEIATQAFSPASGSTPGARAGELLDHALTLFGQLDRTGQRPEPKQLSELLVPALDRYSDLAEGKTEPAMATGIKPLDRLINGGLRPGKVYGIAARPSIGKSAAGRSIGLHTAAAGCPTLLLSQEMPAEEVTDAIVGQLGGIDSQRLQTGRFDDQDWSRMVDAVEQGRSLPFYIDEQGGLRLADMRSKARAVKGLRVLILDYLQLSRSTLKNATTNDQVAEISKGLKALAMELKIAVVVLSQLNREVEKRTDREPQLSDLRDSGAIEQDLDVAVMLWTIREDADDTRLVGWKVAKHRGGRKGRFGMRFDAPRYRWSESAESIDPPAKAGRGGEL
jgi:replicative DNA helicase